MTWLLATEFRDALALRYLHTPPGLPSQCDGCRESFSLQHGLDCPAAVLDSGAVEKKRVYRSAVENRRGNFTSFVQSVDGLLEREASHFI